MRIVQSESNNISLFSFLFLLNIMQKCRTIELSDYRAIGLSIRTRRKVVALPGLFKLRHNMVEQRSRGGGGHDPR